MDGVVVVNELGDQAKKSKNIVSFLRWTLRKRVIQLVGVLWIVCVG